MHNVRPRRDVSTFGLLAGPAAMFCRLVCIVLLLICALPAGAAAQTGNITGTVTDAGTTLPLANLEVDFFTSTGSYTGFSSTNGSGVYTSPGLSPGTYYARTYVYALNYVDELYNDIPCAPSCTLTAGTPITVTAGSTTAGVNFALAVGGSITGTVTAAATALPLSPVDVTIYSSGGNYVRSVTTNGSGVFTAVGLASGTYYALTHASNSLNAIDELYNDITCVPSCTVTTGTPITVTAGSTTSGVNFALAGGGTITGTITDAGTTLPLTSVEVDIYSSTGVWTGKYASTNGSGVFAIAGLPTGTYYARTYVYGLNYVDELYNDISCVPSCTVTSGTPIPVTAGSTTSAVNFALAAGGSITGTVTAAGPALPLANVNVAVYGSTGTFAKSAFTNGSGVFTLAGLPTGTYYARTSVSSALNYVDEVYNDIPCAPCTVTTGTPIAVTAGATTSAVNFALAGGGSIAGTVTAAATSLPVANVTVQAYTSTGSFVKSVSTNGSGGFTLTGLPAGTYYARTFVNGLNYVDELYNDIPCFPSCTVTAGTPITVTVGTTSVVNFALAPAGAVTGTVTDAGTALPLASVTVTVYTSSGSSARSASTNGAGVFTVTGLPVGFYYARTSVASASTYVDKLYNNIVCSPSCNVTTGTPIAVTAGATTGGVNFALATGGSITGTVTDAATALPLANVNVQIYNSTATFGKSAFTNASGVFTANGLAPGTYYARTSVSSSLNNLDELYNDIPCSPSCTVTTGTPITVTAGATTIGVDFALATGGTITGTVTDAGTTLPLASVTVQVYSASGSSVRGASTNASGVYTVAGLPTGTYYARTFVSNSVNNIDELYNDIPCWLSCTVTTGTPITVTAGAATSGVNFALAPGGSITGTVTDAATSLPLANVGAVVVYNSSGTFGIGVSTNQIGVFTVNGLPTGTYYSGTSLSSSVNYLNELYNHIPCFPSCTVTAGTPIAVTAGATTGGVNYALTGGGTISGTVTDAATTLPLASANVQVYASTGSFVRNAFTNASGVYTLAGLSAGTYYVRTSVGSALNYVDELYNDIPCVPSCTVTSGTPIAVAAGAVTSGVNFALAGGGTITGTVTDAATTLPVASVSVQVYSSSGSSVKSINTNASGVYSIAGLPAGTYYARTFVSSALNYVDELYNDIPCTPCTVTSGTPITVTLGAVTSGVNFALASGGSITGTVTDAVTTLPLSPVTVQVYSSGGTFLRSATTSASGVFTVSGLPSGSYYARTFVSSTLNYVDEAYDDLPCVPCTVTSGTPISVTAGSTTSGVNFALAVGGSITGTVTDANTVLPLLSVAVIVYTSGGTSLKSASTNASGAFTIAGLPSGTYYARTSVSSTLNYVNRLYNNLPCPTTCVVTTGTPIVVTAGNPTGGVNFPLPPNLLQNGTFGNAAAGWATFGAPNPSNMEWTIVNGVYQWRRVPQVPGQPVSQATVLQATGIALGAGVPVAATFDLGNTSSARKYVKVLLVGDANFTDLAACTFWLPPNAPLASFQMRAHTTKAWTNATIYFYASSPNTDNGYYRLDNVSMTTGGTQAVDRTECVDPRAPQPPGGVAGPNLLTNGDFGTGTLSSWGTIGTLTTQIASAGADTNVLEFFRGAAFPPPVIAQSVGGQPLVANQLLTATFRLGNSSPVRKRVLILLNDQDFSDLTACTFWLAPGAPLAPYVMTGWASKAWAGPTLSIYPSTQYDGGTPANNPWIRIDDITLQQTPGATTTGTTCLEPAAGRPQGLGPVLTAAVASVPPPVGAGSAAASAPTGNAGAAGSAGGEVRVLAPSDTDAWVGDGFTPFADAAGLDGWPVWAAAPDEGTAVLQLVAPLDLRGVTRASLRVSSWRTVSAAVAEIQARVNGGDWAPVAAVPAVDGWDLLTVDLSDAAGGTVDIRVVLDGATWAEGDRWWLSGLEVVTEP